MTKPFYDFVHKALIDMNSKPQIVVLGDQMQCIYDFPQKGADLRFLTLADQLFEGIWKRHPLRTSYRITKPMEYFINSVVLGYPRMTAVKEHAAPVQYITGDSFRKMPNYVYQQIIKLLAVFKPEEIFILAPSVRSNNDMNPIKILENMLVKGGVPVYVPMSDDSELKDEVLTGKVVFSSFHQSKGLERKVVFVLTFNDGYFQFFGKDKDPSFCPNTLYVAITRAMERLYVCAEDSRNGPLRFINQKALYSGEVDVITLSECKTITPILNEVKTMRRVTDLTRFIPDQVMTQILELCQMEVITPSYTSVNIPDIIDTGGGRKEQVSDLNGIAVPTYYEHKLKGEISIQDDLKMFYVKKLEGPGSSHMKVWIQSIANEPKMVADYLRLANVYSAYISGLMYKMEQIPNYDWLSQDIMDTLYNILKKTVNSENPEFEYTIEEESYHFHDRELQINGRIDLIDDKNLWELKCVESLKDEHVVQLALYAWLWQRTQVKGSRKFLLHNIRTGEVQQLKGVQNLNYIADMVFDNAFRTVKTMTDEEFITMCKSVKYSIPSVSTIKCLFLDD